MSYSIPALFSGMPFEHHRVFDTADLDEARYRTSSVLSPHRLAMTKRGQTLRNRLDMLACGRMSLIRLDWGANVSVDPGSLNEYYLLVLPVKGRAVFHFDGRDIAVSVHAPVIISPYRRFRFTADSDYEQVVLRLDLRAVCEAWRGLTAQDAAPAICFDAVVSMQTAAWQALMPMLQWVTRCAGLGAGQNVAQAALLDQTEKLMATTLLLHQPHDMAARLWPAPPPVASLAVRRAQAYMLEHLGEAVPVSVVASHCGLSVGRLQALFQDECGQSPLQWQRKQRLQAVRQALLSKDEACKVGETAMRYGFTHLGEFAQAYRQAFGETPQQTRGRGKSKS